MVVHTTSTIVFFFSPFNRQHGPNAHHQHHHPPPRRPPRRPARRLAPTRGPRSNDDDDGPHGPTADHHLFRSCNHPRHTAVVDPPPTRRHRARHHAPPPARARCRPRWQQRASRRRAGDRHGGAYGRGRRWGSSADDDAHRRRRAGATRWAEGADAAERAWRVGDATWRWAGAAVGGVGAAGGGVGWEVIRKVIRKWPHYNKPGGTCNRGCGRAGGRVTLPAHVVALSKNYAPVALASSPPPVRGHKHFTLEARIL